MITSSVSTQDWPGAANVDVSIVNWIKQPPEPVVHPVLDGEPLDEPIAASLRPRRYAVERAHPLAANDGRSFFGCLPEISDSSWNPRRRPLCWTASPLRGATSSAPTSSATT